MSMPIVDISTLPDHGRLWVFPSTRRLDNAEAHTLERDVNEFLKGWAAHGVPLEAGQELIEQQFLIVGVDVDVERPSGCSIDALVGALRELGKRFELSLIDHNRVWYREGSEIRSVSRAQFRDLVERGAVSPDTRVFDTSLTSLDQLRAGALEREASQTWHGRAFFRERAAG